MASGPITSWQIDRETVDTVADFILGGSTITADGDCSHSWDFSFAEEFKMGCVETFLVVQWLRIHLSIQGTQNQNPDWGN